MYKKLHLTFATLILMLFVSLTACTDSTTTGSDDDPEPRAVINGTVEDDFSNSKSDKAAKDVENTVVTAARISSNGSLELIEETETQVDASGDFTLEIDADAMEEIVIVADNEGDRLTGIVTVEVENENTYTIKPINTESSAETDVYVDIATDGNTNIIHKSDIETVVIANSAADVYENSSATSDISAGVSNSAEARTVYFNDVSEGDGQANLDIYLETMTDAQNDYELTVYSSTSSEEKEAAFTTLLENKVEAYNDAGLEHKENAEFLHMQERVFLNSTSSVSTDVENDSRWASSYTIAIATDNAVQARAEASNMSDNTVDAIADAGATLRTEVRENNGSEATVRAAFETYHDEVITAMENDSSVEGAVVITIDTEVNAAGGPKSTFSTTLTGLLEISELTDAYINFNNNVDTIVEANAETVGDIETQILSDIIVLINLSS